jgi:hypothetical protein
MIGSVARASDRKTRLARVGRRSFLRSNCGCSNARARQSMFTLNDPTIGKPTTRRIGTSNCANTFSLSNTAVTISRHCGTTLGRLAVQVRRARDRRRQDASALSAGADEVIATRRACIAMFTNIGEPPARLSKCRTETRRAWFTFFITRHTRAADRLTCNAATARSRRVGEEWRTSAARTLVGCAARTSLLQRAKRERTTGGGADRFIAIADIRLAAREIESRGASVDVFGCE